MIVSYHIPGTINTYNAGGTYNVLLTSSAGCDSVATLNLLVNPVVTSTTDVAVCSSQLPFNWNNQSFNTSGSYTVTLVSAAGCDSIATLNLLVNEVQTSTSDINICTNQLPYNWNGQTYSTPGTYTVMLTTIAGCDSIATLNLTASSVVTSTTNVSVCTNQLPYNWNNQVYNSAGTYTVTLTGSSGCDSIATLILTVNSTLTTTTSVSVCNNQLPYSWNGNTYNSSGLYSVTLTSTTGCDSVANLQLTVNNTATTVFADMVCESQLPYLWNGNQYNSSGNYTATLVTSAGCDSVITLQLTVVNTIYNNLSVNICSNQMPYMWNGLIISGPGTFTQTFNAGNGCDSVVTLNLIVLQETVSTTQVSVCSNQLPYQWNGQQFNSSGNYTVLFTNQAGCDSAANLQLTILPVSSSDSYVTVCNNQLPYVWNGNNYSTSGNYLVTLTGSNGCDSIANLHFTVNAVTGSTATINICSNQLPYAWNGQQLTQAGTYSALFTGSAGCDSVVTLQLIVNPVVSSSSNASVCSSQLPFVWNGQQLNSTGMYSVTLVSSAGCDSVVTLHLTVHPTPGVPSVNSPVVYCQFDPTVALTATGANPLLWYQQASGGAGSNNPPTPSSQQPGTFYYYVAEATSFCEGPRVRITVTVNGKPALGPDRNIRVCYGGHINLDSIYSTIGLTATWMLNQQQVSNTDSIVENGVYTLTVSNASGCLDTATVNFAVQPQVIANAGPDGTAEYNYPYQLNGTGGGTYQWFPGFPLLNNSGIANPTATLTEDTRFILMVKDEIGCKAFDTVFLRVLRGPTFYIPNAFSPNGDGLNDVFRPTPVGIDRIEYFRIFNRFGEKVFETSEINKGWDGSYKGIRQPLGGYVWMLKGVDRKGDVKVLKGNVLLVR
ncbi:MAG: gliding motility-associated C-terminal domain-containing protein [Ferruginibacter sp.]